MKLFAYTQWREWPQWTKRRCFRVSKDVSFSLAAETSDSVRSHLIVTRVGHPRDVGHLIGFFSTHVSRKRNTSR